MKKILISLFFVLSFFDNFGQTVAPQGTPTTLTNNRGGYRIDSVLFIPTRDTASLWFGLGGNLSIYNGKLYFNDGNKWVSSGTGGGGDADSAVFATLYRLDTLTASLYDSLTATLRIRDSLLSYVTPTQLSDSIQANKYDTTYLYSVLGNKINYSDTGTMLLPYLRKSDTASLSSRINGKLSISDTSTMLSPYLRKVDTFSLSSRINAKLNIADTSNKWLPIGTNIPDSSTYLTNYRSDTIKGNLRSEIGGKEAAFSKGSIIQGSNVTITGTLTNRLVGSGDITISASGTVGTNWGSIGGTLSDQTDLNNALGAKLNISDTGTMLTPYLQKIDTTGKWLAASTYIPDSSTFATLYRVDTAKSNIRGEIGGKEPTFSKGSIIQGTGVSISGTLTNRLVGSGNITISATGSAGYVQWSDSVAGQLPTTYRIDTIKTNLRSEISNIPIPDSTGNTGFFTNYGADTLTSSVYDSFLVKENKGKIHPFVEVSIATGASTAAKVGTTTGGSYTPQIGDIILLNFNNSNTASNPSVNIDGSGAISIRLGNSAPSNIAVQGTKVLVWYDGTYYQLFGSQRIIDNNTTYSEITEANIINSSSSTTGLITGRRANYLLTQRSLLQTDSTVTYVTPTQLNTGLNNKLNISDTSTMLSPYFRTVDTTGKWLAANTYIPDSSTFATNYKVDTVKNNIRSEIPEQFNPIAGTNISLSGSYPNITFNASGGGGVTELVDLDDVDITTGAGVDGYSVVWDNGTGKFVLDDISGGGGGGATWGSITGTLSDQTDLQTALDGKQDSINGTSTYIPYFGTDGRITEDANLYYNPSVSNGSVKVKLGDFSLINENNIHYSISAPNRLTLKNQEITFHNTTGQNGVKYGILHLGTASPHASAKVDITSTTQGVVFPRMTTEQRDAISSPAEGLIIYDLTTHKLQVFDGTTWQDLH